MASLGYDIRNDLEGVLSEFDELIGIDRIKAISSYAQKNDIKMHMDGARLFVEATHRGVKPASYGEYFDTIYTSMYKCFNAPSGAILAGTKEFTKKLFHIRRMFGGGLPASWPFAAIALHYRRRRTLDSAPWHRCADQTPGSR